MLDHGPALLFCPANRPDRYAKALGRADAVILDLEDAVGPDEKDDARETLRQALPSLPVERIVLRINALGTRWGRPDADAAREAGIGAVMLPKAEDPDDIRSLAPLDVIALCETAAGIAAAPDLARTPGCEALLWGSEDLIADLGGYSSRRPDGTYLPLAEYARAATLLAAGAARIPAIDSVSLAIDDLDGLAVECGEAVAMGFRAKLAIHPGQVPVIRRAFAPGPERVAWAEELLAAADAAGGGVFRHRGRMVDGPLISQALAVLAAARANQSEGDAGVGT